MFSRLLKLISKRNRTICVCGGFDEQRWIWQCERSLSLIFIRSVYKAISKREQTRIDYVGSDRSTFLDIFTSKLKNTRKNTVYPTLGEESKSNNLSSDPKTDKSELCTSSWRAKFGTST